MVQEDKLSAVLSEFAWRLATDFPIQAILDHLVERIVTVLPITAAGVTLISEGVAPHYIASSDATGLRFEQLQTELGEGPCVLAYESGAAVAIPDLREDDRFPRFGPAALAAGMAAVFTFPLRHASKEILHRVRAGTSATYVTQSISSVTHQVKVLSPEITTAEVELVLHG